MLLLLLACQEPTAKDDPLIDTRSPDSRRDSPADSPADSSHDSPADSSHDSPTDSTPDSPADSTPDSPADTAPPEPVVRFVALGDAGEGNDVQYAIGEAIRTVCDRDGCDLALYLGDNFYDSGADDVRDDQFQDKFELPYQNLNFPFYVALGNHDYGGEGIGWELWKGQIYVDYTNYSSRWMMPDLYYQFDQEHVSFFGLDSTQVFWGFGGAQLTWLQGAVANAPGDWKIAYAHHPYISNGPHGNAGSYEGLDWLPIVNGEAIQDFVEDGLCGQVDLYICGHDHSLQWPVAACGTEFIVSGAGAKTSELDGSNQTWFESLSPGFVWIEIRGRTLTGVFYDQDAVELYRRSYTK